MPQALTIDRPARTEKPAPAGQPKATPGNLALLGEMIALMHDLEQTEEERAESLKEQIAAIERQYEENLAALHSRKPRPGGRVLTMLARAEKPEDERRALAEARDAEIAKVARVYAMLSARREQKIQERVQAISRRWLGMDKMAPITLPLEKPSGEDDAPAA